MVWKSHSSITAAELYACGYGHLPESSAASEGTSCKSAERIMDKETCVLCQGLGQISAY